MAKSQETYNKKEKEKKRLKKKEDKQKKKEERRALAEENGGGGLESMMAYVDEYGNITDTPPDETKKKKIIADNIEIGATKRVEEEMPAVRSGKIEFFNDSKGFGFVRETATQEKYFVHVSGLMQEVIEGDKVSFELERGMKGMNAIKVKKV